MINRVVLMGRLVADPELKTTGSGVSVTSFRIAVDRSYVKQGAERQADFFDIVAWRGTAEFVCKHFNKGSLVAIDGQLQSRQYQTKDGQGRTAIEVVADNVSFTGERRDNRADDQPIVDTPRPAQPSYQDHRSSRPAYNRQQTLAETQQGQPSDYRYSRERQREQRAAQQRMPDDARYGGGRPSDGRYGDMPLDEDLPFER